MGDISIIARRLEGGARVQYGWSGNGGCYKVVGARLLSWYDDIESVEYLFGLGQMEFIGKPKSEYGGEAMIYTNEPTGTPHWLGNTEREIFSRIAFIDYGYFYDLDKTWYYIIPGPLRIKVPLLYIDNHLDERNYEFDERNRIEKLVAEYILEDYYSSDMDFQSHVMENYPQGIEEIRKNVLNEDIGNPCYYLWDKYKAVLEYFDDWVVVKSSNMIDISDIIVHKKQDEESEDRVETIDW